MLHMVRVVLSNGASLEMPMAWQEPLSRTAQRGPRGAADIVATRFLEVDYTNHERFTGVPSRSARSKLGRRAKFENRFETGASPAQSDSQT